MNFKRLGALLIGLITLALPARAEELDGDVLYRMIDVSGQPVMSLSARIYEGDEYISGDNQLYVVISVDDEAQQAVAMPMGEEPAYDEDSARAVFNALSASKEPDADSSRKLIALYSTHSDESYEKGDGAASLIENAGIYDVGRALKKALESKGVTVELDTTTHLPHDTKAYSRSRRTVEELLKKRPDALLDIHRDGIPDESEYETQVDGEETSKVRLLVGRSNPNADANREFAKQLKAVADRDYDGLIKDIFIGKGNYNQELYPRALLLEFGTHTLDKELAVDATDYMADVLYTVLYGESAAAEGENTAETNKSAGKGIVWALVIIALGALIYALASTGTLKNLSAKISGGVSELTGGLIGRRNGSGDSDKKSK